MSNLGDNHWHALERVLRYLKDTISLGIHYSGHPVVLEGYSDSNWISDIDQIYATSGYVFTLGDGAVSLRSCKQSILTKSTMEAELTALDTASAEAEWLRELLSDLPVVEKPISTILMNCDNQTMITKVNSAKDNVVAYVKTDKNLADPFTKGLLRNVIEFASREMGMRPI
jgi:hypothetical protein